MTTTALHRKRTQAGVRPFDLYRDAGQVAELIAVAFQDKLGPSGQAALAKMRRVARWGPLLWWLYWAGWNQAGFTPGFVWVEQDHVVGNVSLRRTLEWGAFFVGNVAVHPDWQRQGIGRALMETALEEISAQGGRWVGLEVQADNEVARRLYRRLGFREVGRTLHMLRPAGASGSESAPMPPGLRRGRSYDGQELIRLVRDVVPEPQRPLLELRRDDYRPGWMRALSHWIAGRREIWWVVEEEDGGKGSGALCGAVRVLRERGRRPDRLEVLVAPDRKGYLEVALLQQGIASLDGATERAVETVLPAPARPLVAALEGFNFREVYVLIQMRLDLV